MLKHLSMHHVGPATPLEIDFTPRVTLITGDNGLGKSFVLDVAWWALTRTWAQFPAFPERGKGITPAITYSFGNGGESFDFTSKFDWKAQAWSGRQGQPADPGLVLYARVDGSFTSWDPARNYWTKGKRGTSDLDIIDRPPAYQFSASQVWDGLERDAGPDGARPQVLCNGLIRDWASWQRENGLAFEQLKKVLVALSPAAQERLEPGSLTRVSLDDVRDIPTLKMPYGKEVPIVHASAAVRRIAALAYLLVWSWQEHVRASHLLNQEVTGQIIFLIDEIEAHLHPAWQRRILRALLDVMKALTDTGDVEVQLIAVTHSPLVLASLEPVYDPALDALWMFDLIDHEVRLTKDNWHPRGDVNAWLRSEVFDLKEARSEEAERAIQLAVQAINNPTAELAELAEVHNALHELLKETDPFWNRWLHQAERRGLAV
jgi:hypothetical protein